MFEVAVNICSNLNGLRVLRDMESYLRQNYEIVEIRIIYPCGKTCTIDRTKKSPYDSKRNSVYTATRQSFEPARVAADYIPQTNEPVTVVYTTNFLL